MGLGGWTKGQEADRSAAVAGGPGRVAVGGSRGLAALPEEVLALAGPGGGSGWALWRRILATWPSGGLGGLWPSALLPAENLTKPKAPVGPLGRREEQAGATSLVTEQWVAEKG